MLRYQIILLSIALVVCFLGTAVSPLHAAELSTSSAVGKGTGPSSEASASSENASDKGTWDWSVQVQYARETGDCDYNVLSIAPRCSRRLLQVEKGGPLAGRLLFVLEPSVQLLEDESVNAELRLMPLLRYEFGSDEKIVPFVEGGVGLLWSNCRTDELYSEFTFSNQLRAGLDYHIKPSVSLRIEGFFEHASNAGLASHNPGMEVYGPRLGCVLHF